MLDGSILILKVEVVIKDSIKRLYQRWFCNYMHLTGDVYIVRNLKGFLEVCEVMYPFIPIDIAEQPSFYPAVISLKVIGGEVRVINVSI